MTPGPFDPIQLGARTAANRLVFGPHVTNLCDGRSLSARHAAYYERRARGGCGTIVTEIASVHESDWPYERAPLGAVCERGWRDVVSACKPHGAVVVAGLGHAGMQGSTSWTQDVLWAPSLVANVMTREQPLVMGDEEIAALVEGFADSATLAVGAGCDGVELNAGQHSLLRQFCSGLTNLREDAHGQHRLQLLEQVVRAVRTAVGDHVVGLRFCIDELAPWAGITPEVASTLLVELAGSVDYVCVVRGSIYTEASTQPDGHVAQGFNEEAATLVGAAMRASGCTTPLCLQGSVVDVDVADRLVRSGVVDLVEMTRAQIADPDLASKASRGDVARIRPCILCNQHCLVRDPRNPLVSCSVNPVAGHELEDADLDVDAVAAVPSTGAQAVVVGGGIAGLEAARVLVHQGHAVTLYERGDELGGALRVAARLPGRARLAVLCDWLEREVRDGGVAVVLNCDLDDSTVPIAAVPTVVATGGDAGQLAVRDGRDGSVGVVDALSVAAGASMPGPVVVWDPIGGPIGVAVAELAASQGESVTIVTPDVVLGSQLSATGDLVDANARLARAGVAVVTHARPVALVDGAVVTEDTFTGATGSLPARCVIDAGHRLPGGGAWPQDAMRIGDAVAPRGILMCLLDARRAALSIGTRP